MKERLAVWPHSVYFAACVVMALTPTCQAGPVLTTSSEQAADEQLRFVAVTDGKAKVGAMRFWTYQNFVDTDLGGTANRNGFIAWSAIGGKSSTVALANIGSRDVSVHLVNGSPVVHSNTASIDGMRSSTLDDPIDPAMDGDRIDAYLWTVTDVSGATADEHARRRRTYYATVASDIYSSNYWENATKHQSSASDTRLDTVSEVLKIAAEVVQRSRFVQSIICGARGHFP